MKYKAAIDKIEKSKTISIFSHLKPDADTIGSALALKFAIEKKYKDKVVKCYSSDKFNPRYKALGYEDLYENDENFLYDCDLFIAVDVASSGRLGIYENAFLRAKNSIQIDHHEGNLGYAGLNIIEPDSASNCDLIYKLIKLMKVKMDKTIAGYLYAGIFTDTGGFLHNSTTAVTHKNAAELLEYDFDMDKIHYYLMKMKTKEQLGLYKLALEKMEFHLENKILITSFSRRDYERLNGSYFDTVSIVSFLAGCEGVDVVVVAGEVSPAKFAVSFRSSRVDVSNLAAQFGGGGHKYASGCNIFGGEKTVVNKILSEAKKLIDKGEL